MKPSILCHLLHGLAILSAETTPDDPQSAVVLPDPATIRFTPPPPPKEVPAMEIKDSTTADFGTHRITILRGEPSILPDIPDPPPPVEPDPEQFVEFSESTQFLFISGSTYGDSPSRVVDGTFEVEQFEFNYSSTSNFGWKLSPAGDVLEMGSFNVYGPGDTEDMSHVLRRNYQSQNSNYQSAVSTLHTLDWQGEGYEWLSLRTLGEDLGHRVFAYKWIYNAPIGETHDEIWIMDSNLGQTGSYQIPEGYSLYLHGNQVTPAGWLGVNAMIVSTFTSPVAPLTESLR